MRVQYAQRKIMRYMQRRSRPSAAIYTELVRCDSALCFSSAIMLEVIATYLKDVSVLRKLLFAATHLPPDLPNRWGIAVEFATTGEVKCNDIDVKTAKSLTILKRLTGKL